MKLITDLENTNIRNSIVTLGKFDGNHIGHQLLFRTAVGLKKEDSTVVIFTFSVPPAKVINHGAESAVRTIQTSLERHCQVWPEGIDLVVEFPFNETTRNMEPEIFVKKILVEKLDVKTIVVGKDFCFGKDRSGNVDTLKELGQRFGFAVVAVEKVKYQSRGQEKPEEVSSTRIKQELLRGNLEDANAMLGSPFTMTGEVVHGKHYGRTIGFPTINFDAPEGKILPPNGVYATKVFFDGREFCAITNVGQRPTFDDGNQRTVETNILDFHEDIYGKIVNLSFYKFIRPEQKFESPEQLKLEIEKNVMQVRNYFLAANKMKLNYTKY